MDDYIQNGGLPSPTPNPHFLPHDYIIKKDFKMADNIQTLSSSYLGFRLHFLPIFAGLPTLPTKPTRFWAINSTENDLQVDLDFDGNYL